jgi:hypothetical protein
VSGAFCVVFALYPRVTQLDFTGPLEVLTRLPGATVTLAAARARLEAGWPERLAAARRAGAALG